MENKGFEKENPMFKKTLQKLAWIGCGIFLMASALIPSCHTPGTAVPVKSPTQDIQNIDTSIKAAGTALTTTTKTIETHATQGMQQTPVAAQPILNPHWTSILQAVGIQKQLVVDLAAAQQQAADAEKKSEAFEAKAIATQTALDKANSAATKALQASYTVYSGILFFLALICATVAVFANGNKIAIYGGVICGAGAAVCIFIVQTVAIIAWVVGGIALAALGFLVYLLIKNKSTIVTAVTKVKSTQAKVELYQKATTELVETMEATKPRMTFDGRRAVFGDGPCPGDAHNLQSPETKEIVREVRSKMYNKAPSIPVTAATDHADTEDSVSSVYVAPKSLTRKYVLK